MPSDRVQLEKKQETYLATLYGKALDARAERPILSDRFAAEAVDRIDLDFRTLKLPRGAEITLPIRGLFFDRWTREFLSGHPEATVLHLGCGLDTRVYRIAPSPAVRWFDVDLPEVIALREKLYPDRPGYQRIGASVTDPKWLEQVPAEHPVLVVAEGLLMYLPEPEGVGLLRRIRERFPSGEIAFDAYDARMVKWVSRVLRVGGAKVKLLWGVDDPADLERKVPGLRLIDAVPFLTLPVLVERLPKNGLERAMHRGMGRLRFYRRLVRHLRYTFG